MSEKIYLSEKAALTIPEAAKYSSIGLGELRWQAKNNPELGAFKVGQRKILIDRVKFDAWISKMASIRAGFQK